MSLRRVSADLLPWPSGLPIPHGIHRAGDGWPHVGDRQDTLRLPFDRQRQKGARLPEAMSQVPVVERRGANGRGECFTLRDGLGEIKRADVHKHGNLHHTVYARNTFQGLHHMVQAWFDGDMEVQDIRRKRLRELIADMSGGNITAFAGAVKKSPSQINDMLAGRKPFGEKVARDLERSCRKPKEWFDHEHGTDAVDASHLDPALLRSAILVTEHAIAAKRVIVTPEARAEITLAAYDLIREGQDMQGAQRIVARMLQAIGGATVTS